MATSIRYCPPIKCKAGETIKLNVEGFQSDPERGCLTFFSVVGMMPGSGFAFGSALSDSTEFTPSTPGKYVVRALCCCRPANG
jgi:hypothetical protein